jgi:hypothetical protein
MTAGLAALTQSATVRGCDGATVGAPEGSRVRRLTFAPSHRPAHQPSHYRTFEPSHRAQSACVLAVMVLAASALSAQGRGGPPPAPNAAAPIDLTGYWVSVVNEDWRWRMVTPNKGDTSSVPLNAAGTKAAASWDPATDGSCLAYGAAGLMRMPTRLNITWENPTTLKIETDAGQQTRRLLFDRGQAPGPRSLQGHSIAEWERPAGGRGGPPAVGGSLKVTTTNLMAAWLRRNGVPYSENATMTEHFDRFATPGGEQWLVVTTIVNDPTYLTAEFVTSSHFKKEPTGAKWSPSSCRP